MDGVILFVHLESEATSLAHYTSVKCCMSNPPKVVFFFFF